MVKLTVRTDVLVTEKVERVSKAVGNLFPGIVLKGGVGKLVVSDLKDLKNKIGVKKIGKTVLGQLVKNYQGGRTELRFNKQAAFAGKISLVENRGESPNGPIILEVDWDIEFVSWLTGVEKNQVVELSRRLDSSK